jgi:hypothetical protein
LVTQRECPGGNDLALPCFAMDDVIFMASDKDATVLANQGQAVGGEIIIDDTCDASIYDVLLSDVKSSLFI